MSRVTDHYLELVRARPRPTRRQMAAFARFVAGDHSWYKHLPILGAGEPFFLYLHPNVHAYLATRDTGEQVWREVIREQVPGGLFPEYRIDLHPGDRKPGFLGPLHYVFSRHGTADYRAAFGHWCYWNHGPADQPPELALAQVAAGLRVGDEHGEPLPVPTAALERGLVYLRATVSGYLGPTESRYEELRAEHDLPDPDEDAAEQHGALVAAMKSVVAWVYDEA